MPRRSRTHPSGKALHETTAGTVGDQIVGIDFGGAMDTDRPEEPVLPGGHATCDVSAITYPYFLFGAAADGSHMLISSFTKMRSRLS